MSEIPEDAPATCPTCGDAYDSVSVHAGGLMVSLIENERYRRVCFEPGERDGSPVVYFYHHTHQQAGVEAEPGTEAVAGSDPMTGSEDNPVTGSEDNPMTGSEDNPVTGSEDNPVTGSEDNPVTRSESDPVIGSESH